MWGLLVLALCLCPPIPDQFCSQIYAGRDVLADLRPYLGQDLRSGGDFERTRVCDFDQHLGALRKAELAPHGSRNQDAAGLFEASSISFHRMGLRFHTLMILDNGTRCNLPFYTFCRSSRLLFGFPRDLDV